MKPRVLFAALCLSFVCVLPILRAEDKAKTSKPAKEDEEAPKKLTVEETMQKYAKAGPGVQLVKKDKKGEIIAVVVVGQAEISTVLGKAKGIQLARDKAGLEASGEFVRWLKQKPSIYLSNDGEAVILKEGTKEDENDETTKETGKEVDKSSKKLATVAEGLVRGLQLLHKEVDGEGKTYTVVMGWSKETSEGTKKVAADQASDAPKDAKATKGKADKEESTKKVRKSKGIESDSATSDAAKDFVP